MPGLSGFFSSCYKCVTTQSNPTSDVHNNTQVTNGIVQILTSSIESYAPSAIIPGTLAQVLASFYAISHNTTYTPEKLLHLLQGLTAAARLAVAITLMFEKQQCDTTSQSNTCIASFLLMLIYSGTLSVGLATSTLSKASNDNQTLTHHDDEEEHEDLLKVSTGKS